MKAYRLRRRASRDGAVHIVQKSHQINAEGHLQAFFLRAFQNGLSYENSEITKAPIKPPAQPFLLPLSL